MGTLPNILTKFKTKIMFKSNYKADHSRFGEVLREEMERHGIKGNALAFSAEMHKQRIYDI